MFSYAAVGGTAIASHPKGAIEAGLDNEKHLDQSLWEKDQQLLAKVAEQFEI